MKLSTQCFAIALVASAVLPSSSLAASNTFLDHDFELGPSTGFTYWAEFSSHGFPLIGAWGVLSPGNTSAWLGGVDDETSTIIQEVDVEISMTKFLFDHHIEAWETCGANGDLLTVTVENPNTKTTVTGYFGACHGTTTSGWTNEWLPMVASPGDSLIITFSFWNNSSDPSSVYIDNISTI